MTEESTSDSPHGAEAQRLRAGRGPSPVRWAAAGVIGGASITGMLWSILGRAPAPIEPIASSTHSAPALVQPLPGASQPIRLSDADARDERPPSFASIEREPMMMADSDPGQNQQTVQPVTGHVAPPTTKPAQSKTPTLESLTERLDINRATQAELELLPNIGPTLAGRIIAFRESDGPIRSLTHLTDVRGIGVRTAEAIEPYVRFD